MFEEEKACLKALPALAYDAAALKPVTASSRCRVIFEANRYSIPHLYASQKLTLKIYPDRLCIYHNETQPSPKRQNRPFSLHFPRESSPPSGNVI